MEETEVMRRVGDHSAQVKLTLDVQEDDDVTNPLEGRGDEEPEEPVSKDVERGIVPDVICTITPTC